MAQLATNECSIKLNIKTFALACGLWWGIKLCAITWWIIGFAGGTHGPTIIGRLYRGYSISPIGSVIGLASGFSTDWPAARFSRGCTTTLADAAHRQSESPET